MLAEAISRPHYEAECDPRGKQVVCMAVIEDLDGNIFVMRERSLSELLFGPFNM